MERSTERDRVAAAQGSPPGRRSLTPERVVDAAVALIDAEGLEGLSMRQLGAALEVEAMSLYTHVPSKAALLEAVVERLLDDLELPDVGEDWRDDLREGCRRYRALLLAHPRAVPLFATLQLTSPGVARAAGWVMAVLRRAGFGPESALNVLTLVQSYVIGFAFWEVGTAPLRADPAFAMPAAPVPLPDGADPYLVELLPRLAVTSCDDSFAYGLDAIVAGVGAPPPDLPALTTSAYS